MNTGDVQAPDSDPDSTTSSLHLNSVSGKPAAVSPKSDCQGDSPPPEDGNFGRLTIHSDGEQGQPVLAGAFLELHSSRSSDSDDVSPETSSLNDDGLIPVLLDGSGAPPISCTSVLPDAKDDHGSSPTSKSDRQIPNESDGAKALETTQSDSCYSKNDHEILAESDGVGAFEHSQEADSTSIGQPQVYPDKDSSRSSQNESRNPVESDGVGLPQADSCSPINNRKIQLGSGGVEAHRELHTVKPEITSSLEIFSVDIPAIGEFIRKRSSSISSAISKRITSMKELRRSKTDVMEFDVTGVKVVVEVKGRKEEVAIRGRISFFSRSGCRDCTAVRGFLRARGVPFVEINVDVFPLREKELVERTGSCTVPQIFFEDKLVGGLVALNSLRNSGLLEERMREVMVGRKAPDVATAPEEPVYGRDDPGDDRIDEMAGLVEALREKVRVEDRVIRLVRVVRNCFTGGQMLAAVREHLDCGREKVIEVVNKLEKKHFLHRVFGEGGDLEDGNDLYRFLEHEPFISKCLNFRVFTNGFEPRSASLIGQHLTKIMTAVLESFASEDRRHVDYAAVCRSEEFRRYIKLVEGLQRVDMEVMGEEERLAFFLNLHNAMAVHAVIRGGRLDGLIERRSFVSDFMYVVGGQPYSLSALKNGILRNNQRPPYSFVKPFAAGDPRLKLVIPNVNPLIHFGLCNGTKSGPMIQFFSHEGIEAELRSAAREFFRHGGIEVDLDKRTIYLSRIIKWFGVDFGKEKELVKWIINYLDSAKAGLVTHLCTDGNAVNIAYQSYDWSLNT